MASPAATLQPANSVFAPLEIILFRYSTSLSANTTGWLQLWSTSGLSKQHLPLIVRQATDKSNSYGDPPTSHWSSWVIWAVMVQRTPLWQKGRRKCKEFIAPSNIPTSSTDLQNFLLWATLCSSCVFKLPLCQCLNCFTLHPQVFAASYGIMKLMEEGDLRGTNTVRGAAQGKRQQTKPSDRKSANQCPSFSPSTALGGTRWAGEFESHGASWVGAPEPSGKLLRSLWSI